MSAVADGERRWLDKVRSEFSVLSARAASGFVSNMTDMQVFLFLLSSCLLLKTTYEFRISAVPLSQNSNGPQSTQSSVDYANEEEISQIDYQPPQKEEPPNIPQSLLDALAEPIPPTLDRIPHDVFPYRAESVESMGSSEVVLIGAAEERPDHSLNSRSSERELLLAPKDTIKSSHELETKIEINNRVKSSHELETKIEINNRNQDVQDSLQNADTSIKVTSSYQENVGISDARMCTKCQQNVSPNQNGQSCSKCKPAASCSPPPDREVPPLGRGCCADCKARCLQKLGRCIELAKSLGERVAASAGRALERIEALAAKHAMAGKS